jgi:hypothetical protein
MAITTMQKGNSGALAWWNKQMRKPLSIGKSDATNITDATLHQEPVVSKSWHHTGAFLQKDKILNQFEKDYWYEEMQRQGFSVTHHEV